MTDVTPAEETDNCGCCLPPPNAAADAVNRLIERRDALDARLARLELAGASR